MAAVRTSTREPTVEDAAPAQTPAHGFDTASKRFRAALVEFRRADELLCELRDTGTALIDRLKEKEQAEERLAEAAAELTAVANAALRAARCRRPKIRTR